jgi:DNA-binding SARP family transcriptional activator
MTVDLSHLLHLIDEAARAADTVADTALGDALDDAREAALRAFTDAPEVFVDLLACRVYARRRIVPISRTELQLLCLLALHPRGLAPESLADVLHPDITSSERGVVRVDVHRLRRRLGVSNAVEYHDGRYVLGPVVSVDLPRVEATVRRMRSATLDDGDRALLEGYADRFTEGRPPCTREWPWFEPVDVHLQRLGRDIDVILAQDALQQGNVNRTLTLAHRLNIEDPLDETAREIAIRALLQIGDRAAAIFEYRRYRELLRRELAEEPSIMLRNLLNEDRHAS